MAHLLKQDVFKAILELALQESDRDTLVNSSCQEFFDHMRKDGAQENMKEAIDDIMTRQEALVRQLAQSRFAKTCFEHFILRWEMNTAPEPPKEEKLPAPHLSQPFELRRQEAEEESYFNTDDDNDDDDGSPPLLSTPLLTRHQFAGQKRKRQRVPGLPMRPLRPPSIHLPRAPLIGSLVDYDEDEDDRELAVDLNLDLDRRLAPLGPHDGDAEADTGAGAVHPPVAPVPTPDAPPTPRLSHRLIASAKRGRTPDADDAGGGGNDGEQPDTGGGGGFIPLSPRPEKRRRGDDDGDDMGLERLLSKVKRPSLTPVAPAKEGAAPTAATPPPAGAGRIGVTGGVKPGAEDGGPKKIKLKFGVAGLAVASSAPSAAAAAAARSEPGVKDGDTG
ncbi:hypothetical protein HETIRDRAFT_170259 [Heterobasidion irregulare TC 32-1]|uniref:Serine/threonine-protein phosphatase 4 regulatory subunit 3-like central domain-containing protein n=1 Tax=Heterobasidion irregulare (strain TC 32-1) TaxID=747525 RepID=W4KES0_HETIT|nr:uncharacterized protein HETIRDRAFT_170259 [Heterobasidion irregulare TC 32-1]ETW83795.1 hypothetical protein HETIRDRAFT_170259 [Heterobasidion irregulare TC 32-1]